METSRDAFLGGRLTIRQPVRGYRAGADPVFLAAAVPACAGESVLDLGCGAGTAMLCLLARVPGVRVTGVERFAELADLARANLTENALVGEVVEGDVADLPPALRARSFDHVMTNPPFFDRAAGSAATHPSREAGRGETVDLSTWLDTGLRRLKPGGTLSVVNRIERLPDCLAALGARVGTMRLLPLAPRQGRPAKLFVLNGKKGGRGGLRLLPPLVLHAGPAHVADGDSYTAQAQAILRAGAPLELAD